MAKDNGVKVYYGNRDTRKAKTVQSTKITVYSKDFVKDGKHGNEFDIAIIEFPEIKLDAKMADRAPIYDGRLQDGQKGLIVGWGGAEKGVDLNVLRGGYNIIGKPGTCGLKDNNGSNICLPGDLTPGVSACGGDSGSGMFLNDNGVLMLIGFNVVAVGPSGSTCGDKGRKHIYVNVLYHMDFIQKTTGLSREYLVGRSKGP
ncbi:hypothetical protein LPJ56_000725 [Coemansia sp. RSA 2599]|nr:hypothetical protein LPJ75_000508 [Coemansia sp. RSA 2598]KAJ1828996.1 hypothetical protein LPJ56_000725 [Coemansia sp. RSA 2599]